MDTKWEVVFSEARERAGEFAKQVTPYFQVNNWTWYHLKEKFDVPFEGDIHREILGLIDTIELEVSKYNGFACASTGRLQVRATNYSGTPRVVLELVPSHVTCGGY